MKYLNPIKIDFLLEVTKNLVIKEIEKEDLVNNWSEYSELLNTHLIECIEDTITPLFSGATFITKDFCFVECVKGHAKGLLNEEKVDIRAIMYYKNDIFKYCNSNLENQLSSLIIEKLFSEIIKIMKITADITALVEWSYDIKTDCFIYFDYKDDDYLKSVNISIEMSNSGGLKFVLNDEYKTSAFLSHNSIKNNKYEARNRS